MQLDYMKDNHLESVTEPDYLCFSCYNITRVRLKCETIVETRADIVGMDMANSLYVYCPKCGNLMDPIDREMVQLIRCFNIIGYHTLFCCEGHFEKSILYDEDMKPKNKESFSFPYIVFDAIPDDNKREKFISSIVELNDKYDLENIWFYLEDRYSEEFHGILPDSTYDRITYSFYGIDSTIEDISEESIKKFEELKEVFLGFLWELCELLAMKK